MTNKSIGSFMIKEIIRLKIEGYSHKKISKILGKFKAILETGDKLWPEYLKNYRIY